MTHEPQFYRVDGLNVYNEEGRCVANLNPERYADNWATGWWWLQQHECCNISAVAVDESMDDFSCDFYAYGPYVDRATAVAEAAKMDCCQA